MFKFKLAMPYTREPSLQVQAEAFGEASAHVIFEKPASLGSDTRILTCRCDIGCP